MAARVLLRSVLLLQRDVPRAAVFYSEGLGLQLLACTKRFAELDGGSGARIALKEATNEAQSTPGYSPFLTFSTPGTTPYGYAWPGFLPGSITIHYV